MTLILIQALKDLGSVSHAEMNVCKNVGKVTSAWAAASTTAVKLNVLKATLTTRLIHMLIRREDVGVGLVLEPTVIGKLLKSMVLALNSLTKS